MDLGEKNRPSEKKEDAKGVEGAELTMPIMGFFLWGPRNETSLQKGRLLTWGDAGDESSRKDSTPSHNLKKGTRDGEGKFITERHNQ